MLDNKTLLNVIANTTITTAGTSLAPQLLDPRNDPIMTGTKPPNPLPIIRYAHMNLDELQTELNGCEKLVTKYQNEMGVIRSAMELYRITYHGNIGENDGVARHQEQQQQQQQQANEVVNPATAKQKQQQQQQ